MARCPPHLNWPGADRFACPPIAATRIDRTDRDLRRDSARGGRLLLLRCAIRSAHHQRRWHAADLPPLHAPESPAERSPRRRPARRIGEHHQRRNNLRLRSAGQNRQVPRRISRRIDKTWNAYGCCGDATKKNIDDVAFVTAVVNDIPGVDRQREYATGLSNGAMLAHTMACRTDLFAVIGVVAATMFDPCPDPRPTSVMHIQGMADNLVKFNGTPKGDTATVDGPPIPDVECVLAQGGRLRTTGGQQERDGNHHGGQMSR